MKKYIFLLLTGLAMIGFFSCEEYEEPFYTGVTIYVDNLSMYSLDASVTGNVKVSNTAITELTTSVDIPVALTNGEGSFTFTKADLGISEAGESVAVIFTAEADGGAAARSRTFKITSPLAFDGSENISPYSGDMAYLKFEIADDCTPATSIAVRTKLNSGSWTNVTKAMWDVSLDSIGFVGTDYAELDTMLVEVTASNANGSVMETFEIVFKAPPYNKAFFGWYEEVDPVYLDVSPVYFYGDEDEQFELTIYGFWAGSLWDGMDIADPLDAAVSITMTLDPFTHTCVIDNQASGWGYNIEGTGVFDETTMEFTLTLDFIDGDDDSLTYDDQVFTYEPTTDPNDDAGKNYVERNPDRKEMIK